MKKHTFTTWTDEFDEMTYTVQFEPAGEVLTQRVGDRLVVAYLVQDDDCENPMESSDGEGKLYTRPRQGYGGGLITYGNSWGDHLGLTSDGEPDLELDAVIYLAKIDLASLIYKNFAADFTRTLLTSGESPKDLMEAICQEWLETGWGWEWDDDDREFFAKLPSLNPTLEECWQQLYAEGKIGDYLAIPVSYCDSAHGPGTTMVSTTSVDNCDAVWVPDDNCIENIKAQCWSDGVKIHWAGASGSETEPLHAVITQGEAILGDFKTWGEAQAYVNANFPAPTHKDLMIAADAYAAAILNNYVAWRNGEVFGCVVQTYKLDNGTWEDETEDSCWNFVGFEYAEKALQEDFFKPAITRAEEANAADAEAIRTQFGNQVEILL